MKFSLGSFENSSSIIPHTSFSRWEYSLNIPMPWIFPSSIFLSCPNFGHNPKAKAMIHMGLKMHHGLFEFHTNISYLSDKGLINLQCLGGQGIMGRGLFIIVHKLLFHMYALCSDSF